MVCRALLELAAGAGACCVALYHRRSGFARVAPRGRRVALALLLLAALAVHAELLLSIANSTVAANRRDFLLSLAGVGTRRGANNRAVVSYVEESTKLIRMQVEGKLNAGDLAGVLSYNPGESTDSASHDQGGAERTNTDGFQPPKEQEFPASRSEEPQAPAPPPPEWRSYTFPSDHVLLLGCSGDEFTVRIMPRQEGFEQHDLRHANGDLPDGCLRTAAAGMTLSNYNRHPYYYALFWSLPGKEKFVPVPVMAKESEVAPAMEENPEAFVLSADVVAFYRPVAGRSEVLVRPRNAVAFMPVSNVEEEGQALQALHPFHPHSIIYAD
ncbi:unnamed protein product [Urochloa decumbens]|uniref:Uncharacterized protein n=1 Tax=Urochloa decumbens TaxID=240449 RepID=A0ABC8W1S5_9POAL